MKQPKVLVANRGEIASRILAAAKECSMSTVAIYSKEDEFAGYRHSPNQAIQHAEADSSHQVGDCDPRGALHGYLDGGAIVDIGREHGVDLVHPGYGFLAENADFAEQVRDAGMIFVGPPTEVIKKMGDKVAARQIAQSLGIPVIPGTDTPVQSMEQVRDFGDKYGYPIVIKASFGGGGKGMRVVQHQGVIEDAIASARSEAGAAFGNDSIFLERYLTRPKHVEVQILSDGHGNHIHLFERDCSIQRKHQKVIEFAPAVSIPDDIRQGLLDAAVRLAKGLNYENAGTVEFLVEDKDFYFIEMNPRIQVEHTVTEEITGIDIVAAQLRIAGGATLEELGLSQDRIQLNGFAIQSRVTTEIPTQEFRPDSGTIRGCRLPNGRGVRLDYSDCFLGAKISPFYDSLLVKCICSGPDLDSARIRSIRALQDMRIRGIETNIAFLLRILRHPSFIRGDCWTSFIDYTPELFSEDAGSGEPEGLMRFLADAAINGTRIQGQTKPPTLTRDVEIGRLPDPGRCEEVDTSQPCRNGWRNVLLRGGPQEFARQIRAHRQTLITDTTWRDGQQSLLATRVRTRDLEAIAKHTSHAYQAAYSLENWGGATFDVMLRFLYEDPWERLVSNRHRRQVDNIPFQMLLRSTNGVAYSALPDNALFHFVKLAKDTGIDIFRVFDSLNDLENLKTGIDAVHAAGGLVEGAIMYTGDMLQKGSKYSLDYYMNIVDHLVEYGSHIIAIKSMSGVMKPAAGRALVRAIRAKYPEIPIHMHTHDTNGTGTAMMLACVEEGADIVDTAIDSLSGSTSQPAVSAMIASLEHSGSESELHLDQIQVIDAYWAQLRLMYAGFDADLRSPDPTVYKHEIPGGQYSNLMFQARQNGLGSQWAETLKAYEDANQLLGDIIKATPTSKAVGDLAQFMVDRKLSSTQVLDCASTLDFPKSVVEYFEGLMGQPFDGFPEPLRTKVLRGKRGNVVSRPGLTMQPIDFDNVRRQLSASFPEIRVTEYDIASYVMYPDVYTEFRQARRLFGDLTSLRTPDFLSPPETGQVVRMATEGGREAVAEMLAILPPDKVTGMREVLFRLNGEQCWVAVRDAKGTRKLLKADAHEPGQVAAPMAGRIVRVAATIGQTVKAGQTLVTVSAMKMEVNVSSPVSGSIESVIAHAGDAVEKGDLLIRIRSHAVNGNEANGIAGTHGLNGINGINGINGTDGANGS
ncbi:Pyruvate carboxylase [Hirsutella minnesotensis 3608]|uniref:Pyruvate carboxylase n=1 Tax=Hirsutella minnesotensis 3608 TaxID=1043627 RepID=A0A0F7ZTL8_9HYPO|nr:Pyruvate carboxylase [Hirsutella minnesotensis 3608]